MAKRAFYLLVTICVIFSVLFSLFSLFMFVSCGGNNESDNQNQTQSADATADKETKTTDENTVNTENTGFKDDLPALNFGGKVFTFLVDPDPAFRHFYDVNVEKDIGEIVNDAVYRRNRAVEERLGIVISDVQDVGAQKTITNMVAAGDTTYNGVWLKVDNFFPVSLKGPFVNLYGVPHLNLEKQYWDINAVNDMTVSGKLYGMTGDITTAANMFTHLLMYNKKLAADYELPNLYNLVREGKWTFDKFTEITKDIQRDLNGNGQVDKDDFFATEITPAGYEAFFSSAGEKWVEKNTAGEIVFSELHEKKIAVLDKIESMFTNQPYVWCGYDAVFENERAIFYDGDLGIMCDNRILEFEFGIVPLPKFSEEQDRYYVYAYPFFPFLSIPTTITGEDLEMSGAVLEALASESYRTLTPAFYQVALENKFTRDEESYEMLDIILRSRIYDLLYWGPWDSFRNWGNGLVSAMQKGGGNYVSIYEKTIDKSKAKIDEITEAYAQNN